MYSVITIPFRVGFGVEDSVAFVVSDIIIDSLFGVDIILTCRTAYEHDEVHSHLARALSISTVSILEKPTKLPRNHF